MTNKEATTEILSLRTEWLELSNGKQDYTTEAFDKAIAALETVERRDTAYCTILDLLKEGFEVRLKPDESTNSLFLQVRNGNYVEDKSIGTFTVMLDYDITFALSTMKEDINKKLHEGEKENGQDTDL